MKFVVGGYDDFKKSPFHFINLYCSDSKQLGYCSAEMVQELCVCGCVCMRARGCVGRNACALCVCVCVCVCVCAAYLSQILCACVHTCHCTAIMSFM
jgi:hypothetical protein